MSVSPIAGPSSTRRTVASMASYEQAQSAVDWLSDRGFPVERVTIVGTGLRYVEQVSGRLTTQRAALTGAGRGAMLGLFWGLLFSLFFTVNTGSFFGVLAYGLVIGTLFGAAFGAISHYATRGRRDFTSTSQTRADHYEIQVDEAIAPEAERQLAQRPERSAA